MRRVRVCLCKYVSSPSQSPPQKTHTYTSRIQKPQARRRREETRGDARGDARGERRGAAAAPYLVALWRPRVSNVPPPPPPLLQSLLRTSTSISLSTIPRPYPRPRACLVRAPLHTAHDARRRHWTQDKHEHENSGAISITSQAVTPRASRVTDSRQRQRQAMPIASARTSTSYTLTVYEYTCSIRVHGRFSVISDWRSNGVRRIHGARQLLSDSTGRQ